MVESTSYSGDTNGQVEETEQWYTDPNGVPMPRKSFQENQYTVEQLRSMKQKFLMENVINCGYDPNEFAQFLEYKMVGGTNVDNWEFEALMVAVGEFQQHYQIGGSQTIPTDEDQDGAGNPTEAVSMQNQDPQSSSKPADGNNDSDFQDITDDAIQYRNEVRKEDVTLPRIKTQTVADTAKIVPTKLNGRKVTLKVVESEIRKGGFFASDYVVYTITTSPMGWRVGRKDSDFYMLRKILKAQFPHILVPPLPLKSNNMSRKFLTKREKKFQRFLQAISRSEELKSSICLTNFLEIEDLKEFQKANKIFEKTKYGKAIVELVTEKGKVSVKMNQNAIVFCTKMPDFTDSYQVLYQEIIDTTREIREKSAELAKTMHTLGEHLEKLSSVNHMIRVDRIHELYAWLSKMSTGTGNHIANLGDLFHVYLGSHLKYHMAEHESFREIYACREQSKQNFIKKERHLIDRKEKLFRSQDISRWGFEGPQDDLIRRKDELLNDKEKGFRYMLTKDSQQLESFREELFFYSNQCLSEVRRVGQDNGLLLTDHFITMSQIQCAYINQHHVMWADFLSHFSEIGMVEGGEAYQIIKQRPSEYDHVPSQTQKPSQENGEEETKVAPQTSVAANPRASSDFIGQAAAQQNDEQPGHHVRRISKLEDVSKFQASLDAVRVNPQARAGAQAEAALADPNTVRENIEEEEANSVESDSFIHVENEEPAEESKQEDQAAASEPPVQVVVDVDNDDDDQGTEPPHQSSQSRESGGDNNAAVGRSRAQEESAGGEQSRATNEAQEAN